MFDGFKLDLQRGIALLGLLVLGEGCSGWPYLGLELSRMESYDECRRCLPARAVEGFIFLSVLDSLT